MSQPKRYNLSWTAKALDPEMGAWVEYSDYAVLAAENELLKASVRRLEKENAMIQEAGFAGAIVTKTIAAENERLRKAGSEMADYLDREIYSQEGHLYIAAWLAAKEGRDAK